MCTISYWSSSASLHSNNSWSHFTSINCVVCHLGIKPSTIKPQIILKKQGNSIIAHCFCLSDQAILLVPRTKKKTFGDYAHPGPSLQKKTWKYNVGFSSQEGLDGRGRFVCSLMLWMPSLWQFPMEIYFWLVPQYLDVEAKPLSIMFLSKSANLS